MKPDDGTTILQRRRVRTVIATTFTALVVSVAFAACSQRAAVPNLNQLKPNDIQAVGALSIIHAPGSRFWEYILPAGINPTSLANGPNNTVWFPACNGSSKIYRLSATTGAVASFSASSSLANQCGEVRLIDGYLWYALLQHSNGSAYIARVTPGTGAISLAAVYGCLGGAYCLNHPALGVSNIVQGSDRGLWLSVQFGTGYCNFVSGIPGIFRSLSGSSLKLPLAWQCGGSVRCCTYGYFQGLDLASAADNNLYLTAQSSGGGSPSVFAIFQISTAPSILKRIALPAGSSLCRECPVPIVSGPDKNLWIAEPGLDQIARMTTSGAFTVYHVPTANAGLAITTVPGTVDATSALWFTETSANKIARISTSGSVTEYSVPTAMAQPTGITYCPTTVCGAHGGVWFTETAANKIARYDFP